VTPDSIPVDPNSIYTLNYYYYVDYVSGDSDGGFNVNLFTQSSNNVPERFYQAQPYIKNPYAAAPRYNDLSLDTYTINIPV
jgi:hypothetical protein